MGVVTILAATAWSTNADLIADCVQLGYLRSEWRTIDPTYGRGNWWKKWRPDDLVTHDLKIDGVDFRDLPEPSDSLDVVAFDPPYIAQGGRATSTAGEFMDRYGLVDVPKTTDETTRLIVAGIDEFSRVTKRKGILLLKCMNYVNGGRYRTAAYDVLSHATSHGWRLIDELVHLRKPGPQPNRDRQMHARRNYSVLFVLQSWKSKEAT